MACNAIVVGHLSMVVYLLADSLFAVSLKWAVNFIEPLVLIGVRGVLSEFLFLFATVTLEWPLLRVTDDDGHTVWAAAVREWKSFIIFGFIGVYCNQVFAVIGMPLSTATNFLLLLQIIPVVTALLLVLLRMEKVGILKLGGIAVCLAGVLVMLNFKDMNVESVGNIYYVLSSVSLAVYLVLIRLTFQKHQERYPPIFTAFAVNTTGTVFSLVTSIIAYPLLDFNITDVSAHGWMAIAAVSSTSVLYYLCLTIALRHISALIVSIYVTLIPFVGGVIAWLLLGERLTIWTVVGGAVVLAGVFLVLFAKSRDDMKEGDDSKSDGAIEMKELDRMKDSLAAEAFTA